ncbi:unnamed protein product [Pleuronectes platessa]|uniref:Uncharacterized protein n=1 Tax=Pleuronectes platessa TaxID=8262 RepID=A0A9N7V7E0_PLEPL|nr:unnamed protein product [Pleuronectes platessa]
MIAHDVPHRWPRIPPLRHADGREHHPGDDEAGGGNRKYCDGWKGMDETDMRTYVGLLILAGVYRSRSEAPPACGMLGAAGQYFVPRCTLKSFTPTFTDCCTSMTARLDAQVEPWTNLGPCEARTIALIILGRVVGLEPGPESRRPLSPPTAAESLGYTSTELQLLSGIPRTSLASLTIHTGPTGIPPVTRFV